MEVEEWVSYQRVNDHLYTCFHKWMPGFEKETHVQLLVRAFRGRERCGADTEGSRTS